MPGLLGKRALVVLVLLVVVGVAFAAYNYFYTWTKHYRIRPLTSFENIRFTTTGGTIGIVINYTDVDTGNVVGALLPMAVIPYAIPPEICIRPVCPPPEEQALQAMFFAPKFPEPPEGYQLLVFISDPPFAPLGEGLPYNEAEVALLIEAKYKMIDEAGFNNATYIFIRPRPPPVYHEVLRLEKKSYVNFAVPQMQIEMLTGHFLWLIEMEYIFHPGDDGILGTEDDYLYAIVLLPLVNPWQQPAPGYTQILLGGGEYGVIKVTCYWTKPVTEQVNGSFTIHIWAQEYQTTPPTPPS